MDIHSKAKSLNNRYLIQSGPVDENVVTRELVTKQPSPADIVKECGAYYRKTSERNFTGEVLGYVTPVILIMIQKF